MFKFKCLVLKALETTFHGNFNLKEKRDEPICRAWFINRTESHLEPGVRHRTALYVHHLVDFHTWELPSTADLLRVVETSHRITHSLSKLSTFLANSTGSSFLISEPASVASLFYLLMCDEALVSR